ncbi:silver-binding protein SilE, partial [Salmonella enterica subsp. enterica serovar Alachua]|nr:silver-binding protein SilE [Salmonella enterica subsp. enterica serovar Alachua]
IQGTAPRMTGMDQHEQAIIAHETMTNGSADAHQKMVESHQKMMGNNTVSTTVPSTSYAAMDEHERAAVAHEFMNNGQSGPHQAMAEAHRRMINVG